MTEGLPSSVLLKDVAAVSATDVWAAGGDLVHGGNQVFHWDGRSWRPVPFSALPGAGPADELRLTAAPGGPVWLNYFPGIEIELPRHSTLLRWDGRRWRRQSLPCARGCGVDRLTVGSASDVWATGTDDRRPLAAHWDGRRWLRTVLPSAGTVAGAVVASSPGNAWLPEYACASTEKAQMHDATPVLVCTSSRLQVAHWNGRRWSANAFPAPLPGQPVERHAYAAADTAGRLRLLAPTGDAGSGDRYLYFDRERWCVGAAPKDSEDVTAMAAVPGTSATIAVGSMPPDSFKSEPFAMFSGPLR
ncbi:hypothetical protein [Actinoallomurus sp. CA-150999]|uniref:hypothetical protein n=1 Tax=Actinoallomurus sp. CA-150999 TaxID=3239887 RepID=UPI003D8E7A35